MLKKQEARTNCLCYYLNKIRYLPFSFKKSEQKEKKTEQVILENTYSSILSIPLVSLEQQDFSSLSHPPVAVMISIATQKGSDQSAGDSPFGESLWFSYFGISYPQRGFEWQTGTIAVCQTPVSHEELQGDFGLSVVPLVVSGDRAELELSG